MDLYHKRPNVGLGGITPIEKLKLIQQQNSTPTSIKNERIAVIFQSIQ